MLNLSKSFRRDLYYDKRNYLSYADITLKDGTVIPTLTNDKIWNGGFTLEDAVSQEDKFGALGSAIINASTLTLNNIYGEFSEYDFDGATVVLSIGKELTEGDTTRLEKVKKGTYKVDDPQYNGATISLYNLDYMHLFEKPYSLSTLTYPATLDAIVRDACTVCGVLLNTYDFPHKSFVVKERPSDEALTFLDVIAYVSAIAGCFARCNTNGELELKWFDQASLEGLQKDLNGGQFDSATPYATGDSADGGVLNPWNTGYEYDDKTFETERKIHLIAGLRNKTISTDDVVITGIRVVIDTKVFLVGTEDYVIEMKDNPLISDENAQEVTDWLAVQLIGLRFRKANINHLNDPSIEAGDIALVWDEKGNEYPILVTSTSFSVDGLQRTICSAETPSKNSATRYAESTKAYAYARKMIQRERTQREAELLKLSSQLSEKSGLYSTKEETDSGDIYYLHDRPTLDDSQIVYKMTTNAMGVSTDGGKTWNAGLNVDGDMITRILSTIGVKAEWIDVESLVANKLFVDATSKRHTDFISDSYFLKPIEKKTGGTSFWYFGDTSKSKVVQLTEDKGTHNVVSFGNDDDIGFLSMRNPIRVKKGQKMTLTFRLAWVTQSQYGSSFHVAFPDFNLDGSRKDIYVKTSQIKQYAPNEEWSEFSYDIEFLKDYDMTFWCAVQNKYIMYLDDIHLYGEILDYVRTLAEITEDGIQLRVSKEELFTLISQSPEQITLKGNRLVVEADNFSLDKSGKVSMKEATIEGTLSNLDSNGNGVSMMNNQYNFYRSNSLVASIFIDSSNNLNISNLKGQVKFMTNSGVRLPSVTANTVNFSTLKASTGETGVSNNITLPYGDRKITLKFKSGIYTGWEYA